MKQPLLLAAFVLLSAGVFAQTSRYEYHRNTPAQPQSTASQMEAKKLPAPNLQRQTLTVMEAFQLRKSVREYRAELLSEQDLSDLLWAAQGVNRDNGNLTAPTAMNRQEILLYVFAEQGVCLYTPKDHSLTMVAEGDHRDIVAGRQDFAKAAPVSLVMVGDFGKFGRNDEHARSMVSMDAAYVSQNIDLFCAAAGLATVPRATMDAKAIQALLGLNKNQVPLLNNPVGYPRQ